MSDTEDVVDLVVNLLIESKKYPWKTARYLSSWLSDKGHEITPDTLEEALLQEASRG